MLELRKSPASFTFLVFVFLVFLVFGFAGADSSVHETARAGFALVSPFEEHRWSPCIIDGSPTTCSPALNADTHALMASTYDADLFR